MSQKPQRQRQKDLSDEQQEHSRRTTRSAYELLQNPHVILKKIQRRHAVAIQADGDATDKGFMMVTICEYPVSHRDTDLERRVANFLLGHKIPALREIEIHSDRGEVTLKGRVSSFYQRQLCISCCRHVAGVIDVIDKIQVA